MSSSIGGSDSTKTMSFNGDDSDTNKVVFPTLDSPLSLPELIDGTLGQDSEKSFIIGDIVTIPEKYLLDLPEYGEVTIPERYMMHEGEFQDLLDSFDKSKPVELDLIVRAFCLEFVELNLNNSEIEKFYDYIKSKMLSGVSSVDDIRDGSKFLGIVDKILSEVDALPSELLNINLTEDVVRNFFSKLKEFIR